MKIFFGLFLKKTCKFSIFIVFQQGDAGGDVDGVLQVVAADEDGGSRLLVVLGEHVLQACSGWWGRGS